MSKASNAVLALCRAFYGKRIKGNVYDELVVCKSLPELLSSLRSKTVYSSVLENVAPDSAMLEEAVKKFVFDRFMSICRYEMAIGNGFYEYFLTQVEIDEILKATLFMFGKNKGDYLISFSPFVDRHLSIDLFALGRSKSFDDILLALDKTAYEKVYRRIAMNPEKTYLSFEEAFSAYLDEYLLKLCKKCYKGKEREEVLEIIKIQRDLAFVSRQLRICRYYPSLLIEDTTKFPVPEFTLFTPKQYHQLKLAKSVDEVAEILKGTVYRKCVESDNIDDSMYRYLFARCKKQIRFSSNPGTVTYCYLFLAENEKRNLTHIIEGIKYKLPADEIKSGLVFEQ